MLTIIEGNLKTALKVEHKHKARVNLWAALSLAYSLDLISFFKSEYLMAQVFIYCMYFLMPLIHLGSERSDRHALHLVRDFAAP